MRMPLRAPAAPDALALPKPVARVRHLLPILEGGAPVIAPEFGARVQRGEIGQCLGEAARLPIGGAAAEILRDVEAEGRRQLLLLDRPDVEIDGRRDMAVGQRHAVIDRRHRAIAEHLAGQELGRPDRRGEFLEQGCAVLPEAEQQIRHEHRHEPRQPGAEIRIHLLEVAVALP